jgi:hypothetical protein
LYVGLSVDAFRRTKQHKSRSRWWNKIAKVSIEKFEDQKRLVEAEARAIFTECPVHNKVIPRFPVTDAYPHAPTGVDELSFLRLEVLRLQVTLDEIEAKRAAGREKKRVYMKEKMRGYRAADRAAKQEHINDNQTL